MGLVMEYISLAAGGKRVSFGEYLSNALLVLVLVLVFGTHDFAFFFFVILAVSLFFTLLNVTYGRTGGRTEYYCSYLALARDVYMGIFLSRYPVQVWRCTAWWRLVFKLSSLAV